MAKHGLEDLLIRARASQSIQRARFRAFRRFGRFRLVQTLRHFVLFLGLGPLGFRLFTRSSRFRTLLGPVLPIRASRTVRTVMTLLRLVATIPLIAFRALRTVGTKAVSLKLAQGAEQRFDLAFVGELLAFGEFDQFQNFFHLLQRLFQRFDDLHHFVDGLADGGTIRPGHAWRVRHGRFKPGARRQRTGWLRTHRMLGQFNGRFSMRRHGRCGRLHGGGRFGWHRRFSNGRYFGRFIFCRRARTATPSAATAMTATATTWFQTCGGCWAL